MSQVKMNDMYELKVVTAITTIMCPWRLSGQLEEKVNTEDLDVGFKIKMCHPLSKRLCQS